MVLILLIATFSHLGSLGDESVGSIATVGAQSTTPSSAGSLKFASIVAGLEHTCGILSNGQVLCWGSNLEDRSTPPAGFFQSVSAGVHNCGIRKDGSLNCWGWNDYGQSIPPAGVFTSVGAGRVHSCGLRPNGSIECWGLNHMQATESPAGKFDSISVGVHHNCAVTHNGSVACWGWNSAGQSSPKAGTFKSVYAGYSHSCGITAGGNIECWGDDEYDKATPPGGVFRSLSTGYHNTCGLQENGYLVCWGSNEHGQSVPPNQTFISVSTRFGHTCGITTDGEALCWGRGHFGEIDVPSSANGIPIPSGPLVRGQPGDYWADVIIGKPDFSETTPGEVVPFKVFKPGGVAVDQSIDPGRAYVWDAGNSRILGIDLGKCYNNEDLCNADLVIGQPSLYDHSACNGDSGVQNFPYLPLASADSLCGTPGVSQSPGEHPTFVNMSVDDSGNLYVPDSYNHRVLFYERPFETDTVADAVWGQQDFNSNVCNQGHFNLPTASTLCFHSSDTNRREPAMGGWPANGVQLDDAGNLWVADTANHRVLRFPVNPTTGLAQNSADLVLGQPDFHHNGKGADLRSMFTPAALLFGPSGRLFVADTYNNRVLIFDLPFWSGMPASGTFGHQHRSPITLTTDPYQRGMWIGDVGANTITLWGWDGELKLKVGPEINPTGYAGVGGGFAFDKRGNLLATSRGHRPDSVLRIPAPLFDEGDDTKLQTDKWLFYPPGGINFVGTKGVRAAFGVATFEDQLIVSDHGRLMFWNGLAELTNGKPADGVVGDVNHHRDQPSCCDDLKADAGGRLWAMASEGNWEFIDVYQLPLTDQAAPLHTIWTKTISLPVLGTNSYIRLGSRLFGMAPAHGGASLWLSDTDNHRVLRIRNPLTDPLVDVILGQDTPNGNECNRGEQSHPTTDMLCFPGDLSIDRLGNLWVSDHALEVSGNFRLLTFDPDLFPTQIAAAILAPEATSVIATHGNANSRLSVGFYEPGRVIDNQGHGPYPAAAFETAFDSHNNMAVGFNLYVGGRFVAIYTDPLEPRAEPAAYLNDLAAMPVSATFDDQDNLYIGDHNRGRVLVYRNPLNNPPRIDGAANAPPPAAPLPEYRVTLRVVAPEPPSCILRTPGQSSDGILEMIAYGLPSSGQLQLQFRKVTDSALHTFPVGYRDIHIDKGRIFVKGLWSRLWSEYERTAVFVRVLHNGQPLSNWSTSFMVADDAQTCGRSQPEPNSTSTPALVPPATNIRVVNGHNPGEFIVTWDGVSEASHYRIGYINIKTDYPIAKANGDWREAFNYVDLANRGQTSYTIRRLEPGALHAFAVLTNSSRYGKPTWPSDPAWVYLTVPRSAVYTWIPWSHRYSVR